MEDLMDEPEIKTGFTDLDKIIGGLYPGELVVISSKFSKGKSSFLRTIIKNVAFGIGCKGLFFCFDLMKTTFHDRWVSSISDIPMREIRSSRLRERWCKLYKTILDEVCDLPIIIYEDRDKSIDDLCDISRRMVKEEGVKIIYIDDLCCLNGYDGKTPFADVISDRMQRNFAGT